LIMSLYFYNFYNKQLWEFFASLRHYRTRHSEGVVRHPKNLRSFTFVQDRDPSLTLRMTVDRMLKHLVLETSGPFYLTI